MNLKPVEGKQFAEVLTAVERQIEGARVPKAEAGSFRRAADPLGTLPESEINFYPVKHLRSGGGFSN